MVVASNGQAYSGNFGFDLDGLYDGTVEPSAIAPASLIRVDPDGTSCEAADDLSFPNGTVITDDGGTLIIAESFGRRLTRVRPRGRRPADQPARVGHIRRAWRPTASASVRTARSGWPTPLAPECVRVAEGGEVHERVTTSMNCYACMLGDEDRRTLYLVTAVDSDAAKARAERNGALEKVRTTVPGAGLP